MSLLKGLTSSQPRAQLLQWLYTNAREGDTFPARLLARRAGVLEGSIPRLLTSLVDAQLLIREELHGRPVYRVPYEDPRLRHLILFIRQDSDIVKRLSRAMRRVASVQYACIFGSFARGATHKDSDIDVLALVSKGAGSLDVFGACAAVGSRIGREVNPQIFEVEGFSRQVATGESLARSIIESRVELKGSPPWPR